jgi:hypothetical protein
MPGLEDAGYSVKRGGGGFKAELEHAPKLRRGRPLGLSMARVEDGTMTMARRRVRGGAWPAR